MTKKDAEKLFAYWLKSSTYDWKTFLGCSKTKNYVQAMFFLHLFFEKKIKALIVKSTKTEAPFGHNLVYLLGKLPIEVPQSVLDEFEELSKFNLVTRYPDEKFEIYKTVNLRFVNQWQKKALRLESWLEHQLDIN